MPSGVVIAGGRSTRFGDADKAVADLAGTPMIRRVADRLSPVVDGLVVNCRPDQTSAIRDALDGYDHPVTVAEDERPDEGPVAGIMTGLRAAGSAYAAVVACDMPFLDPNFVAYLFGRARDHDAAVPRPDEWFQPIQAVYRAAPVAAACEATLDGPDSRIVTMLDRVDAVTVGPEEVAAHAAPDTFENLNTREEFEAAAERF
ncbi:MAG: molybdenum cofactor guanylyltransferase [Haloferacaceae archaeon]